VRKKIPAAFKSLVSYFNHSELTYANNIALDAGTSNSTLPFDDVEILLPDNGERFFSEHLTWKNTINPKNDAQSRCFCSLCDTAPVVSRTQQQTQPLQQSTEVGTLTHADNTTPTVGGAAAGAMAQQLPKLPKVHQALNRQPSEQAPHHHHLQIQPRQEHYQQQQHLTHTHQQPYQQQFQHTTIGHYPQHVPMITQFPPWIMTANNYPVPITALWHDLFCCGKYRQWHDSANRRGRPQHDYHCPRPRNLGNTGGKIEHNPNWSVI